MVRQIELMNKVRRVLDIVSAHLRTTFWKQNKKLPHTEFVKLLSEEFQAELVGDEEQEHIEFEQCGILIYNPFCESIDSKMRLVVNHTKDRKQLIEVNKIVEELLGLPFNKELNKELVYQYVIKVIRILSKGYVVLYPVYGDKKNSNCFFSVLTFFYSCFAYLAGIDNRTPIKLISKLRRQSENVFENWVSVPAISMGQESARKAQFPDEREQKYLESLICEHPIKLIEWAKKSEVIYNLTLKNLKGFSSSKDLSLHSYHVLLTFEDGRYQLAEVYEVDENNFGIKKPSKPSAELCKLIQKVIDSVELDGKTGRSVSVRGIHSKSAVNVRTLGTSVCDDTSYLAVQISKHGRTVQHDEFSTIH